MKTFKKSLVPILTLCCSFFLLTGCGNRKTPGKGTIRLTCGNWTEGIAVSHLLESLIGDMGYTVKTTIADPALAFTAMADGQQDVFVETWLPTLHRAHLERHQSKLEIIGTWFEDATVGFVVPEYVEIDSINELNGVIDHFDGKIFGIEAGCSTMDTTAEVIKQYDLNYTLIPASEPAMIAVLKDAIIRKKWAVIIGWEPHIMFAHHDLKFLDDPKKGFSAEDPESIQFTARKGFRQEYPEISILLKNMKFNASEIASLMEVSDNATLHTRKPVISQWISKNQTLIDSWFVE